MSPRCTCLSPVVNHTQQVLLLLLLLLLLPCCPCCCYCRRTDQHKWGATMQPSSIWSKSSKCGCCVGWRVGCVCVLQNVCVLCVCVFYVFMYTLEESYA